MSGTDESLSKSYSHPHDCLAGSGPHNDIVLLDVRDNA